MKTKKQKSLKSKIPLPKKTPPKARSKKPKAFRVILFGATGMVGSGVLKSCLEDPSVSSVVSVGRSPTGVAHPKHTEIIHRDLFYLKPILPKLKGFDACLFALGVSSAGMSEANYSRLTHDLTVSVAAALLAKNPKMSFVYISGQGTDTSEKGKTMWARVKGRTENKLLAMGFPVSVMARPGAIKPMKGVRSKTPLYRMLYAVMTPALSLLLPVFPKYITTSERLGRAMILAAQGKAGKTILESADINALAKS